MKSSPVFTILERTLIELEHAIADFICDIAPLSESLKFVGLESNLLNVQSIVTRVLEADRAVRSTIGEHMHSEITIASPSRRCGAGYRLVSDGG